jgi:hydrogenase maturation protease
LYLLQPEEAQPEAEVGLDPHGMDPVRVLATARSLGEVRAEIFIVGCEPQDFGDEMEGRMGLSPAVTAAIPEAVKMVQQVIERLTSAAEPEMAASSGGKG